MGVNAEPRKPALARLAYISASGLIRTAGRSDAALVEMSTAGSGCGKDLWLSREARVPVRKQSAIAATMSTTCLNSVVVSLATTSKPGGISKIGSRAATAVGDTP